MLSYDETAASLSAKQIDALKALPLASFKSAASMGCAASTLSSLVKQGLAGRKWLESSYREPATGYYRITGRGVMVRKLIAQSAA